MDLIVYTFKSLFMILLHFSIYKTRAMPMSYCDNEEKSIIYYNSPQHLRRYLEVEKYPYKLYRAPVVRQIYSLPSTNAYYPSLHDYRTPTDYLENELNHEVNIHEHRTFYITLKHRFRSKIENLVRRKREGWQPSVPLPYPVQHPWYYKTVPLPIAPPPPLPPYELPPPPVPLMSLPPPDLDNIVHADPARYTRTNQYSTSNMDTYLSHNMGWFPSMNNTFYSSTNDDTNTTKFDAIGGVEGIPGIEGQRHPQYAYIPQYQPSPEVLIAAPEPPPADSPQLAPLVPVAMPPPAPPPGPPGPVAPMIHLPAKQTVYPRKRLGKFDFPSFGTLLGADPALKRTAMKTEYVANVPVVYFNREG